MNGRLEIGFQVWAQFVAWDDLMRAGTQIDRLGFDTLWSNDHFYPLVGTDAAINNALHGPIFEGWMVLSGFAHTTERVRLGCMVSGGAYRNVGLLGKMATTLDHASHGRAIVGLGAGWYEREHASFGFDFPPTRQRLDRLEESARALRLLFSGAPVDFEGTWVNLREARLDPGPVQSILPLLIGGSGPRRTLPIVARYADMWNGEGSPEEFAQKSQLLSDLCRTEGRTPDAVTRTVGLPPPFIRSTQGEAAHAAIEVLCAHGMPHAVAEQYASTSPLVGPVERVADHLAAYGASGADGVVFDWPAPFDEVTLAALSGPIRDAIA